MRAWIIYAMAASAAYGLSAIPLKYAANRNNLSAPSELVLLSSCAGALIGSVAYLIFSWKSASALMFANKEAIVWSGLSGLISVAGSLAVIKALGHPLSDTSNVMALMNTNVFFTVVFGAIIFGEMPEGIELVRVILGALFIVVGAGIIAGKG
ncbi:MAG: hypothetical protein M1610_01250 [Nitrospirae bacterium]|nr:hypothetical protein [Nitrospirota bacterium]MDA8338032.1 hypothetical protein [Nitrospiraceae bacterium]